jgi:hypothetical protein
MKRTGFVYGTVFPPGDVLSEWIVVLAMASNDLVLTNVQADEDSDTPYKLLYWTRIGIAHFHEAAKYLDQTSGIPEVAEFIKTLPPEAQARYAECLRLYRDRRDKLEALRSDGVFHYPALKPSRKNRPVGKILERLAGETGSLGQGKDRTIKESRLLFADDVSASIFMRICGGEEEAEKLAAEIAQGVAAFMAFADAALDAWFVLAAEKGAKFFDL